MWLEFALLRVLTWVVDDLVPETDYDPPAGNLSNYCRVELSRLEALKGCCVLITRSDVTFCTTRVDSGF